MRLNQLLNEIMPFTRFGTQTNRIWYNAKTGDVYSANDDGSHSKAVLANMELFGITDEDLLRNGFQPGTQINDYDGRVLLAAMRKGWVRFYADARNPDTSGSLEGVNMTALHAAALWLAGGIFRIPPIRIVVALRRSVNSEDALAYPMGKEEWKLFVETGKVKNIQSVTGSAPVEESVVNEVYSRENQYLLKYLRDADVDHYSQWWDFCEWVQENVEKLEEYDGYDEDDLEGDSEYEGAKRVVDAVKAAVAHTGGDMDDLNGEEPDLFDHLPEDVQKDFKRWYRDVRVPHEMSNGDAANMPTWAHMDLRSSKPLPNTTWLIHFTDDPMGIVHQGFRYGVDEMDRLGLTTYFDNDGMSKKHGGYNFAFTANSREAVRAAHDHKYGRHAVLFQSSGVHAYHHGDEENQIIFWGKDVNPGNIIPIMNVDGDWAVPGVSAWRGDQTRDHVFSGDFNRAVAWVVKNFAQYKRVISTQKAQPRQKPQMQPQTQPQQRVMEPQAA